MRFVAILITASIVIATHVFVWISVAQNRTDATGGTLTLTERELVLVPRPDDSTAVSLELRWSSYPQARGDRRAPQWLDRQKLEEIGFDVSVDAAAPDAEDHYRSMPARPAFLAMEFEGRAWTEAAPEARSSSRLFAIDVGVDPKALRSATLDSERLIVVHATIRVKVDTPDPQDGPPRIQGFIDQLLPPLLFVPHPYSRRIVDLRARRSEDVDARPRYMATVSWGSKHEPWIVDVQRLSAD